MGSGVDSVGSVGSMGSVGSVGSLVGVGSGVGSPDLALPQCHFNYSY